MLARAASPWAGIALSTSLTLRAAAANASVVTVHTNAHACELETPEPVASPSGPEVKGQRAQIGCSSRQCISGKFRFFSLLSRYLRPARPVFLAIAKVCRVFGCFMIERSRFYVYIQNGVRSDMSVGVLWVE